MSYIFNHTKSLKNNELKKAINKPRNARIFQSYFFLRCNMFVQESIIV